MLQVKHLVIPATALALGLALVSVGSHKAEAAGYRASRSYSNPRPTFVRPRVSNVNKPQPQVVHKTTVIQQNHTTVHSGGNGGGSNMGSFISGAAGAAVGAAATNLMMAPDEAPAQAPTQAPAPQVQQLPEYPACDPTKYRCPEVQQ